MRGGDTLEPGVTDHLWGGHHADVADVAITQLEIWALKFNYKQIHIITEKRTLIMRKAASDLKYTSLKCLSSGLKKVHFDSMKTTFELVSAPDITEEEEGDKGQPQNCQHQGDEGARPGGSGPGGHLG